MEIVYYFGVILSITGAICVAIGRPLIANYIWIFANLIFIIKFTLNFDLSMLILFGIYFVIALFGINYLERESFLSKELKRTKKIKRRI